MIIVPKARIITAIDIGTSVIKGLQAYHRGNGSEPEVLAMTKQPSGGIRKGVVENKEAAAEKIRAVLDELYRMSQRKIDGVVANIGGGHIFAVSSQGVVVVAGPDQKITQGDIDRALAAAQAISLSPNKEILEVWPRYFAVDQERGIKEPLGMKGVRIEAEVLALCGFSPYIRNIYDAFSSAGVQVFDVLPSPLASARSVLNQTQKELGCAVIDIGARTTDLAVFEDGELLHAAVFPIGSANITDDIAIALRVDTDTAEKIKLEFGIPLGKKGRSFSGNVLPKIKKGAQMKNGAQKKSSGKTQIQKVGRMFNIETPNGIFSFPPALLSKVMEARLSDIFEEVNKELKKVSRQELLPAGVVLTGGGANLKNLVELAKRELRLPCQVGFSQGINGVQEDPSLSTLCGLALEGLASEDMRDGFAANSLVNRVKGFFRTFIP